MHVPVKTLINGVEIPMLGFGTYKIPNGQPTIDAVTAAVSAGYRLIDTAWFYGNEESVGEALQKSGVPREDVFISTKLWNAHHGYDSTLYMFEESLEALGTDYLDLYLIHWPGKHKYVETWRAFIRLYEEGRARAIGVCNFLDSHLQRLLDETGMLPMLDQIELHPRLWRRPTIDFCTAYNVCVQAWSSLMRAGEILEEEAIVRIAKKHNKTPAQVILRWETQKGICVIPKTVNPDRMRENIDIFDFMLDPGEIAAISALNENRGVGSDPRTMTLDFV